MQDRTGSARELDRHRMAELFRRHADAIYAYASHRVPPEDARDLVGEVFLVAWRRFDTVRPGEERAWLFGIARRLLVARGRQLADLVALRARVERYDPGALIDVADTVVHRTHVLATLSELSDGDREALLLAYWYDLSPADAARVTGCSRATFAVRLHRARKRFARALGAAMPTATPPLTAPARPTPRSMP